MTTLQVYTSDLDIPSELGDSRFLQDLSEVSGEDLVGQDVTAESLGLAEMYTVSLVGSCQHDGDSTECTDARNGYVFDPRVKLRLDSSRIAGLSTPKIDGVMGRYETVSMFMAVAYTISVVFLVLAPILSAFSSRVRLLGWIGGLFAWLAAALLLAASITGQTTFAMVSDAIKKDMGGLGISSETGLLLIPSWVAFGFAVLTAITIFFRGRSAQKQKAVQAFDKGKFADRGFPSSNAAGVSSEPQPGLLNRVQTWGRQRYMAVGRQPMIVEDVGEPRSARGQMGNVEEDQERLVPQGGLAGDYYDTSRRSSMQMEGDYHSAGPASLGASGRQSPHEGDQSDIALMPLKNRGQKDMNTAYEPYSSRN